MNRARLDREADSAQRLLAFVGMVQAANFNGGVVD
jgi:hypothetical protein